MHATHPQRFASWTPDTGTTELPRLRRGLPLAEQPTVELPHLWLVSQPTRHYTPRARLARRWQRIITSRFADHLRDATRSAFWPAVAGAGVFLGLYLLWVTRGGFITWSGFEPIPTGGAR